jgi:hypothetical protein
MSSSAVAFQVYKTTNLVNNKIYIGVHCCQCKNCSYLGSGRELKKDIKLFGKNKFKKEILFYCSSKEEMEQKEKELVNWEFINRKDTYNISLGGAYNQKGLAQVVDSLGNNFKISILDERYLRGEFKSCSLGYVVVTDGKKNYRVTKDDPRYLSGKLWPTRKGKVSVRDKNGNNLQVSIKDERFLSGELESVTKNKVIVTDGKGNYFSIYKNDPRYNVSLTPIAKNKICVIDKNGNRFTVDKSDERYLNGELKGINSNKKYINNGLINKMVSVEQLNNYLNNGYKLGMLPKRINKL